MAKKGLCDLCGKHGYINSHHLIPKSEGGSNHKSNLANLCLDHHSYAHELIDKGIYYSWRMTSEGRKLVANEG
ncbi:MAG: hypothetical protein CMB80_05680 [Flammeovirgaceae bacterium]|nr:hypothetical protein [Flammeovirgaceae bacterium]|tara:strand:+ start:3144 stop:3362 length:219 start_codon:yes stop_codon:yes gene_type:complete